MQEPITEPIQQPELTEQESLYEDIQGGAIDAFDAIGWDVVEKRVIRQLFDRKAGYTKDCILLIGMPVDVSRAHSRLCKNPLMSCLPEFQPKWIRNETILPGAPEEILPEIPGLLWHGRQSDDNGWAGKSSWGKADIERMVKELDSHNLLASKRAVQRLIEEVEHSQITDSPITTVVLCWQQKHDQYLQRFCEALPYVVVYSLCDGDPTGAKRSLAQRFGGSVGSLWDSQSEMTDEKELQAVIEHIANRGESTWIFAPPKHGKTWVMLCIAKSLLTGKPLFDVPRLHVPHPSKRLIYLCPEASRTSLRKRLKMLGLIEHLYDSNTNAEGRLYVRSLSKGPKLNLDDPELLKLAANADIFIDTAIRYLEGNENDAGDVKQMTEKSLNLLAVGARSTWVAHHSGKQFASATEMTLENCSRGSTEFTAALTNAIGMCQLDKDKNLIHFHFIDGRDMDEPATDMHLQGRPYLSQLGNFQVTENVDRFKGRNNKSGPKSDPEKQAKIAFLQNVDGSLRERTKAMNAEFGTTHATSTAAEWLKNAEPFDSNQGEAR
jgi:RecA-family ATPase